MIEKYKTYKNFFGSVATVVEVKEGIVEYLINGCHCYTRLDNFENNYIPYEQKDKHEEEK